MKKFLILIVLILSSSNLFAEMTEGEMQKAMNEIKAYNAAINNSEKQYYDTGELLSEGSMANGVYRSYYKNGKLAMEGEFKDTQPYNGPYRAYDENGKMYINQTYKDGQLLDENGNPFNGINKVNDAKGNLIQEIEHKDGIKDGIGKSYRNGKLHTKDSFKEGMLDGVSAIYDENGNVAHEFTWSKNMPVMPEFKKNE